MTNGELATICGAIVTGLGGVGGVLKWGIGQITLAINTNTTTMLKFVESAARLEVKLDHAHAASVATAAAAEAVKDEITGVHHLPQPHELEDDQELQLEPPKPLAKVRTGTTPIGGYPVQRRPGIKGGS